MVIFLLGICQRWVYIDILKDETTWIINDIEVMGIC